jgi:ent-kaurene synthase
MMIEAEWGRTKYVPTTDEYIANAYVSYGLAPIVPPSLYFVGQELLESAEKDQEYNELFRLLSTCGRLLNDLQGLEVFGLLYDNFLYPCKLLSHSFVIDS